ncbi:MAG: hypothetical protein HC778_06820 [Chamaesiphon sp. CSU_1_12]|nr:hypothetical protein [Chamaesiphon sp. CSU_1_12]
MNTSIIPATSTENLAQVTECSNLLTDEERQLTFQEQLMLDREAYYQDSQY